MQTLLQYLAQVQHLLPEAKRPGAAAEIVEFYEAGDSVDACVSALRDYYARDSIRGIAIPSPKFSVGRQQSASLAAARLVRDYGKNRALHMAVHEADNNLRGSKDFAFWTDVGSVLIQDL
jgi:hypothetical protein